MKKLALALLLSVLLPVSAMAAGPYLVCNPVTNATSYYVQGLPTGFAVTSTPDSTGKYGLKTDVGALPAGSYTVTATACLVDAIWGTVCSQPSSPFVFTKPAAPSVPAGLALSVN